MPGRKHSIGRRISNLVVISTGVAMMIVTLILSAYQIQNSVAARRAELVSTSYVYASAIAEDLANGNKPGIDRVFHSTAHLHDVVSVYAVDSNDDVISSSGAFAMLTHDLVNSNSNFLDILAGGRMPVSVDVVRGGLHVGRLVMVGDISMIRNQLFHSILATMLAGVTALAVAKFFSTRLQRKVTEPIVKLTQSMAALTRAHRYEPTEIANAEGETRELVASFNGMITEIRNRDEALQKLAYFDTLSGLPNRANFLQALEAGLSGEAQLGGANLAVYVINIDNFSALNDTIGQKLADALLAGVAGLFAEAVQPGQLLARLSADEFALIAPDIHSIDEANRALAPFVASLYQPLDIEGQAIHLTAGVGFALAPQQGTTASEVLRHANLALAEAKRQGAGRVVPYFPELGERTEDEAAIERGLRQALDNHEIEVHYQPIVSTENALVEGFEALMRWHRADGSFVPPFKFIPVAEKAGLINGLGRWIMRQACQDAAGWIKQGHAPRFVSVNISASQVLLAGFIDEVKSALRDSGLPPHLLCLELTESMFVGRSMNLVRSVLEDAAALGVLTALDDFGTGYSSLSYLEHLPFDKLKIDRSFVHQKTPGSKSRSLLKGIVDLAHALNIDIVAEGAEVLEEVKLLRDMGAQCVQGYYFSRPLPAADALGAALRIEASEAVLTSDVG